MTTHTISPSKRERVAMAIASASEPPARQPMVSPEWIEYFPEERAHYEAMADAAIAALLPDREAFKAAINDIIACAMEWGVWESREMIEAYRHEANTIKAAHALLHLVYGEDAE